MNLVLLYREDFISNHRVRLQGRRCRHILDVIGAAKEDELRVGLVDGLMGTGRITFTDGHSIEMDVTLNERPPAPTEITLLISLPRPKVMRRVVYSACTLGIKNIYLMNSFRVEKSFWQTPELGEDKIRERLILGLEQAGDTVMPKVHVRNRFKPFVEDELPSLLPGTVPVVAHPGASSGISIQPETPVVLAVGPEGGFIKYEIEKLAAAGFTPVSLGKRLLPVETAIAFLAASIRCKSA